jgi:hypothetical protein
VALRRWGITNTDVVLVNVKRGGKIPPGEWNELWDLAQLLAALPIVAYMPGVRGIAWKEITGIARGSGKPRPWVDWRP